MSLWRRAGVIGLSGGVVAGLWVAGAGIGSAQSRAATASVSITNGGACGQFFCFTPQTLTVAAGTTVTWTNNTTVGHTVTRCDATNCPVGPGTGTDPTFGSAVLNSGQTFSVTFHGTGTYNYYCQIHGYSIMHGTVTVTAAPLAITTRSLPGGKVGTAYLAHLKAIGGTTPYHWKVTSGTLPAGLTLAGSGRISGTPTTPGTSTFTVKVTDSSSPAGSKSATLSITVAA